MMAEPSTASREACRICGGGLRVAFAGAVLDGVPVSYHVCTRCHSLLLLDPHWLSRAYESPPVPDPDTGMLRRTLFVDRALRRMHSVGLFRRHCRCLDYGAGRGLLVRFLLDRGCDAWGYDPLSTPIAAEDRILRELPAGPFRCITAIEVVEHLLDPIATLRELRGLLDGQGVLVLSTELFDQAIHDGSWHYLAQPGGQHITIFSREGLRQAAERAGLRWVMSLPFSGIDFLHLLVPRDQSASGTEWRVRLLRLWQHWRELT